jgi:type IV secretory pathway VirB2 component (pilin)
MSATPDRSRAPRIPRVAISRTPTRDALQATARAGLVARGVVYGVIGILAFKLALGAGGKTESQTGALKTIASQTFGDILLIVLATGLAAYAIWRMIAGVVGTRPEESGALQRRVSAIASGVAYAALCYTAIKIIADGQGSSGSPKHATAGVLGWPGGPVIVAIAGVVVVGAGAYQGYKGISRRFEDDSDIERMAPATRTAFAAVGVTGHVARAVTFVLIGYGLITAAFDYSATSAVGLDGALQKLAHASLGPVLLGIVALGFIAFGLYSIADARYHKV